MTEKYLQLGLKDYLEQIIILASNKDVKISLASEANAPKKVSRYEVFFTDGTYHAFGTWSQFIAVIVEMTQKGLTVNLPKTLESLEKFIGADIDREIIVRYTFSGQDEEIAFSEDLVVKNSKKMSAAEFKSWLPEYLETFGIEYTFEEELGVQKILKGLKETIDK